MCLIRALFFAAMVAILAASQGVTANGDRGGGTDPDGFTTTEAGSCIDPNGCTDTNAGVRIDGNG